ncbi:MAG: hypothetical protein KF784_08720 [Fimbriimonadaceae bacterium]|nr:hypothetical protein [Fimbriimonadaceae bacterium]
MNNKYRNLNQLNVQKPCPKEWDAMHGDDKKRFCDHCQKHVHNISAMNKEDAERLLANRTGAICVRYTQEADGRLVTTDRLSGWRKFALLASGVAAIVGLSGCQMTTTGETAGSAPDVSTNRALVGEVPAQNTTTMGKVPVQPEPSTSSTTNPALQDQSSTTGVIAAPDQPLINNPKEVIGDVAPVPPQKPAKP